MTTDNNKPANPRLRWASSSLSVTGNVRKVNEDSLLDLPAAGLWVVADGMGGHNAGDVASRMIVQELSTLRPSERPSVFVDTVDETLRRVNRRLYESSIASGGGLSGSTVVVLAAFDRYVACLWAGDSRLYRVRAGVLQQLTRDHSEMQEQADRGFTPEETVASNVITRAVGGTNDLSLDFELFELADGDSLLLCSDGLYRELTDADIGRHLAQGPEQACRGMIDQALAGECADNVSVVVVRIAAQGGGAR
jgi:serine/threonine protein phosphatase PrpC